MLPGHQEAVTRGIDSGLVADADEGTQHWEFNVFRNRFAKEDGLWTIKELRIYPLMKADFADGWGKGGASRPADGMLPAFIRPNPVTGKDVALAGAKLVAADQLTAAPKPAQTIEPTVAADGCRALLRSHAQTAPLGRL